jgi:hypothetical protein
VTQRLQLRLELTHLPGEGVHGVEELIPLAHRGLV